MQLKPARYPGRSNLGWVVIDTDQSVAEGPYAIDCHPCMGMPEVVEYFVGDQLVKARTNNRIFFQRKRDAQAAIDLVVESHPISL